MRKIDSRRQEKKETEKSKTDRERDGETDRQRRVITKQTKINKLCFI